MRTRLILLGILFSGNLLAQQILNLEQCQQLAKEHAPRLADTELIRQMGELKLEQAGISWLPSLDLNGKATYQSDVVEFSLEGAPFEISLPKIPHDQYGFNLDVRQNIYDGGMSGKRKFYEEAVTAAEMQQVEVDLYGLKGKVNAYYFPVLVLQENYKNLEIHMENLDAREKSVQAAVEQGAVLESELKVIQVEILKNSQRMLEVESQKRALLDALEVICGIDIQDSARLELPEFELTDPGELNRPEHLLFDLRHASLEAGKELAGSQRMPVLYAYGQTGYGKPGYNMMSSEWDFYYMVGAGLHWKIWDWNTVKKDKQVLAFQQQVLMNQRQTFDQELHGKLVQEAEQIEQYKQIMEIEKQVLDLQEEISDAAVTKLTNGTMTASDYITELNKESMARIRLVTNRVQMMQAMANYLVIQGNL
jgi:outer membrane protein TolC